MNPAVVKEEERNVSRHYFSSGHSLVLAKRLISANPSHAEPFNMLQELHHYTETVHQSRPTACLSRTPYTWLSKCLIIDSDIKTFSNFPALCKHQKLLDMHVNNLNYESSLTICFFINLHSKCQQFCNVLNHLLFYGRNLWMSLREILSGTKGAFREHCIFIYRRHFHLWKQCYPMY